MVQARYRPFKTSIFLKDLYSEILKYSSSFVNLMDLVCIRQIVITLKMLTFTIWGKPFLPLPNTSMAGTLCWIWICMIASRDKSEIIQNLQTASQHCSVETAWNQNICESLGLMSSGTLTAFFKILPSRQGASGTCMQARKMMTGRNEAPETSTLTAVGNGSYGI